MKSIEKITGFVSLDNDELNEINGGIDPWSIGLGLAALAYAVGTYWYSAGKDARERDRAEAAN